MRANPGKTYSPSDFEILVKEADTTMQNIRSSLVRLASADPPKVTKAGRGSYCLPPWGQAPLPNVSIAQK